MKYPLYVPSRKRAGSPVAKSLNLLFKDNIDFTFVVDPSEQDAYHKAYPNQRIISPHTDNLGIGMARQVALEDARNQGALALWQMDDDVHEIRHNGVPVTLKGTLEYFENRLDTEPNIGVISPQYQQVIWRQKDIDTVNGQCPCVLTLSRTNVPIDYDVELELCEDYDWLFKFVLAGYDGVMDNRYGFNTQKYGRFANKVGGVEYRDEQVFKVEAILEARYPGVYRRFGEKFRKSWKTVKSWRNG